MRSGPLTPPPGCHAQSEEARDHEHFPDLESNLRAQVERIRSHPWVKDVPVGGVVYEVESGRLRHVV